MNEPTPTAVLDKDPRKPWRVTCRIPGCRFTEKVPGDQLDAVTAWEAHYAASHSERSVLRRDTESTR